VDGLSKRSHQVGARNNADEFPILDHGQSFDATILYKAARLAKR
jgi:hypothetical protein